MAKTKPVLVDEAQLFRLIGALDLGDTRRNELIGARWLNYVLWWDARAAHAKRYYQGLRSTVVIAGAALPALIGARELEAAGPYDAALSLAAIAASLIVAICAGLESVFAFGDVWREKRAAAERMKIEGFQFFQLTGQYNKVGKTHSDLYPVFARRVETLIEREIGDYIALREKADDDLNTRPPPAENDDAR